MRRRTFIAAVFIAVLFASTAQALENAQSSAPSYSHYTFAEKFIRTEIYFGRGKPDGTTVSGDEWQKFLDEFVTPRFPDGLTVFDADGQWRGKDSVIAQERSKVLVLLYPRKERKTASVKIDEIRAEYKKRFNQESVLRLDFSKSLDVSF